MQKASSVRRWRVCESGAQLLYTQGQRKLPVEGAEFGYQLVKGLPPTTLPVFTEELETVAIENVSECEASAVYVNEVRCLQIGEPRAT